MSLVHFVAGAVAGFVVGIGASIFYLRWKMHRQLGDIQEQMETAMNLNDEVSEMFSEDMSPGEDVDSPEEKDD
ncbi:MAG: hypothetical protein ABEJ75_02555 [Candidatus Nanohaloarchaea archaeon]